MSFPAPLVPEIAVKTEPSQHDLSDSYSDSSDKHPTSPSPTVRSRSGRPGSSAAALDRESRRKITHTAIEKKRRERINQKILELRTLVPSCASQESIQKVSVLEKTVEYIRDLQLRLAALSEPPASHTRFARPYSHPYAQVPPPQPPSQRHGGPLPRAVGHQHSAVQDYRGVSLLAPEHHFARFEDVGVYAHPAGQQPGSGFVHAVSPHSPPKSPVLDHYGRPVVQVHGEPRPQMHPYGPGDEQGWPAVLPVPGSYKPASIHNIID
ncbi:uncharacterized protein BJ171DRAFT_624338 [Polychytrium aggregatum]|uniref:uncharacterized protein n=1 Tax=Polychytrium aggregatum TaxID=110093 RepID=UPI0022FF44A3|nr:uncharacterized protein BJ171DRAFT_624338 [Polychytrium aggregatum]KAI9203312.1 hypothetical protein BJ171DRAFT_624338 [Polychytrium aggregatum]